MRSITYNYLLPGIIIILLGAAMLSYRLAEVPSLSFDEGWTLSTARNWVERGQYALLLQGDPVSAINLTKPFSVTGPVALSFSLFGVGIWQGRLPAVISMLFATFLLFQLARKIFSRKIAYLTLFVLLFIGTPSAHLLTIGRQALAEAPMVFYLVAGYFLLLLALKGNIYALVSAMIFWGLALDSKGHVLPFWSISIFLPALVAALRKEWKLLKTLLIAWVGSFPVFLICMVIQRLLFKGYPVYGGTLQGFFSLGVVTLSPTVRLITLTNILIYAIPTLVGLLVGVLWAWREFRLSRVLQGADYLKLSLLSLTSAWFAWFALLSLGWARYFFPIAFFGSLFVSQWILEVITRLRSLVSISSSRNFLPRMGIYLSIIVLVSALVVDMYFLRYQFSIGNADPERVSEYIRQNSLPTALVETYESELMFLMDNPVHYPSDQVTVDLNRRTFLNQEMEISYDPSQVNFEYLIIGPTAKMVHLYSSLLQSSHIQMVFQAGDYDVYQQIH